MNDDSDDVCKIEKNEKITVGSRATNPIFVLAHARGPPSTVTWSTLGCVRGAHSASSFDL